MEMVMRGTFRVPTSVAVKKASVTQTSESAGIICPRLGEHEYSCTDIRHWSQRCHCEIGLFGSSVGNEDDAPLKKLLQLTAMIQSPRSSLRFLRPSETSFEFSEALLHSEAVPESFSSLSSRRPRFPAPLHTSAISPSPNRVRSTYFVIEIGLETVARTGWRKSGRSILGENGDISDVNSNEKKVT
jgi:hypothetical protein